MFLEVINTSKNVTNGQKLSRVMQNLVSLFQGKKDKLSVLLGNSPAFQRFRSKLALARAGTSTSSMNPDSAPESLPAVSVCLPLHDILAPIQSSSPLEPIEFKVDRNADITPTKMTFEQTAARDDQTEAAGIVDNAMDSSRGAVSLADRLFPLEFASPESTSSGVDIEAIADRATAFSPKVLKRDWWAMCGLTAPKKSTTRKPGPNGFVVETDEHGVETETDITNLIFLNEKYLMENEQMQVDIKIAKAEAKKAANKSQANCKAKAKAKCKAKAKAKGKAKAKAEPAANSQSNAEVDADAKAKANLQELQENTNIPKKHFQNVLVTTAATGIKRSYVTGINNVGKRQLITELTETHNPEHKALMTQLKSVIEEQNYDKDQAKAWRDSQKL
jgi:ribosomal protein L19E